MGRLMRGLGGQSADMLRLLLVMSVAFALPCAASAADAPTGIAAAVARRAWTWFGLTEPQARAQAGNRHLQIIVTHRDGQEQPQAGGTADPMLRVRLLDGLVHHASVSGREPCTEGSEDVRSLVWLGLTEQEAMAAIRAAGRPVRVVMRDGEGLAATMDYREDRVNLTITEGRVTAISGG